MCDNPSLFGITKGIVCQQVNCQKVMGAGLAKAIMDQYPIVYEKYKHSFVTSNPQNLFGTTQVIKIAPELYVANIYSQFYYGNPSKTGKIYTDADKLVKAVGRICDHYNDLPVYLPHTSNLEGKPEYGIGCGYGGERWERLEPMFIALHKNNLHLLDTKTQTIHEFPNIYSEQYRDNIIGDNSF